MTTRQGEEHLVERLVNYTIEVDGHVVLVEHVPARVNEETGERFFAPETVERLQEIIWNRSRPDRIIETPVFELAAQLPLPKIIPSPGRKGNASSAAPTG